MTALRNGLSIMILTAGMFATSCASTRPATDGYIVLESRKFMCGASKGLG